MAGDRIATAALLTLGVLAFLATAAWTFLQPMNPDEVEHLHSTYLILQGERPFADFWQSHSPLLWLYFAPAMAIWPENASICYLARAFGLVHSIVSFVVVVWIAHRLSPDSQPRRSRIPLVAILMVVYWGAAIPAEFPIFRADGLMILSLLLAGAIAIRAEETGSVRYGLFAGVLVGLGLSFSIKLTPLVVAFPAAILLRDGLGRLSFRRIVSYAAGCALGTLPLVSYLWMNELLTGFYHWVVVYNRASGGGGGGRFGFDTIWVPVLLALLSIVVLLGIGDPRRWRQAGGLTVRLMAALVLISTFTLYPLHLRVFAYYLAPIVAFGSIFIGSATWTFRLRRPAAGILSPTLGVGVLITAFVMAGPLLWMNRDPNLRLAKHLEFLQWMVDASLGEVVHCQVPSHPIYARDLTSFSVPWQIHYAIRQGSGRSKMLLEVLGEEGSFADALRRDRPRLLNIHATRSHLLLLEEAELIDGPELEEVRSTLARSYRTFGDVLYVRRDR